MPIDSQMNIFATKEFLAGRVAEGRSMHSKRSTRGLSLFSYGEPIAFRKSKRCLLVELEWKYSRTTERHRKLLMGLAAEASVDAQKVTREEIRSLAGLNPLAPPPRVLDFLS